MAHVSLRTTKDNTDLRVKQPPPQPPALGSPSEGFSVRSVQTTGRCVQPTEPRAQGSFLLGDAVGPEAAAGAAPGQGPAGGGGGSARAAGNARDPLNRILLLAMCCSVQQQDSGGSLFKSVLFSCKHTDRYVTTARGKRQFSDARRTCLHHRKRGKKRAFFGFSFPPLTCHFHAAA